MGLDEKIKFYEKCIKLNVKEIEKLEKQKKCFEDNINCFKAKLYELNVEREEILNKNILDSAKTLSKIKYDGGV